MTEHVVLSTVHGEWPVVLPEMKLRLRARLPGASAFDDAAFGLRAARNAGTPIDALLAPSFASSWLVNSAIPSPSFQKWLAPALRKKWCALVEGIEARANVDALLAEVVLPNAPLGALTKVLSLLSLEPVPLMPDAALAFVLRAVPVPKEPDAQTAPLQHFAPMMARASASEVANATLLQYLAAQVPGALRPRDVVDRLVWFDSVGYRHFKNDQGGWYWVRSESREAVVFVPGAPPPDHRVGACVDVPGDDDFSMRALAALEEAVPPVD